MAMAMSASPSHSASGTMRAGQWDPSSKRIVINTIPIPTPGTNQMLIRITSASLCHTDIMSISRPDITTPFTIGHEGCGVIAAIHPSVTAATATTATSFAQGDAIGFLYILGCCFSCEGCMVHNRLCQRGTPGMQGWDHDGFFAEYAVVDYRNAIHLPPRWSLQTSSVFFCAGITAFHAMDSCEVQQGQWVAVVGVGGLGQLATQYAKAMGARVVAVDISDGALEVCKAQGAEAVVNSKKEEHKDWVQMVRSLTEGGVHAAAVFSNASEAYRNAVDIIRVGGLLMVVGLPHKPLEIDSVDLAMGKYRIKAEATSIPQRMKKAVDFSAKHRVRPEVELRKLEELDDMVREMKEGRSTKRMAVCF